MKFAKILYQGLITELIGQEKSGKTSISLATSFYSIINHNHNVLYFSSQITEEKVKENFKKFLKNHKKRYTQKHLDKLRFFDSITDYQFRWIDSSERILKNFEKIVDNCNSFSNILIVIDDIKNFTNSNLNGGDGCNAVFGLKYFMEMLRNKGKKVTGLVINHSQKKKRLYPSGQELSVNFRFAISSDRVLKENPHNSIVTLKIIKQDYLIFKENEMFEYNFKIKDSLIEISYRERKIIDSSLYLFMKDNKVLTKQLLRILKIENNKFPREFSDLKLNKWFGKENKSIYLKSIKQENSTPANIFKFLNGIKVMSYDTETKKFKINDNSINDFENFLYNYGGELV